MGSLVGAINATGSYPIFSDNCLAINAAVVSFAYAWLANTFW